MIEIIPAVLAKNYRDLQEKITRYANYANIIQIDICDGVFVDSKSWPMQKDDAESIDSILREEEGLPCWEKVDFEFDLMVANASQKFDFFIRLGAKRIIFHLEAEVDKNKFIEFLEGIDSYTRENIAIGLAINSNTSIDELNKYINLVDFIQFMGIENIGHQSQPFDEKVTSQVKNFTSKYSDITISVDGGVDDKTAPMLAKAGAKRLVVGSFLEKSLDIKSTITNLQNL